MNINDVYAMVKFAKDPFAKDPNIYARIIDIRTNDLNEKWIKYAFVTKKDNNEFTTKWEDDSLGTSTCALKLFNSIYKLVSTSSPEPSEKPTPLTKIKSAIEQLEI